MLPLFIAYYNLLREHQAIGKTPAKQAGINLNRGNDKWLELIKRAHHNIHQENSKSNELFLDET